MSLRRRATAVGVAGIVAGALLAGVCSIAFGASGGGGRSAVDLKVALRIDGECGQYADDLPALVAATGVRPGERVADAGICLVNRGKDVGHLLLSVVDRLETEVACTGDEANVDATCGGNGPGELGRQLVVVVSYQERCRGDFTPAARVPFGWLDDRPVPLLLDLRPSQPECLALGLEYAPVSEARAIEAQTDEVRWRYAFDLVE